MIGRPTRHRPQLTRTERYLPSSHGRDTNVRSDEGKLNGNRLPTKSRSPSSAVLLTIRQIQRSGGSLIPRNCASSVLIELRGSRLMTIRMTDQSGADHDQSSPGPLGRPSHT